MLFKASDSRSAAILQRQNHVFISFTHLAKCMYFVKKHSQNEGTVKLLSGKNGIASGSKQCYSHFSITSFFPISEKIQEKMPAWTQ